MFQIPHLKTITINLLFHVRSFQNTPYLKGIPNVQPLDCNSPSHEALINKTLQLPEAENILHTVGIPQEQLYFLLHTIQLHCPG